MAADATVHQLALAFKNDEALALIKANPQLLNSLDADGATPLLVACSESNAKLVEQLLELNPNLEIADKVDQTPLLRAAKNGSLPIVKMLVAKGANLAAKETYGRTAEAFARERNHPEIADFLKGVAAGTIPRGGTSGLVQAILQGDLAQVQELLKTSPALAQQIDTAGRTPLHVAVNGKSEIAALLLDQKADANKADTANWRPMHIAAEAGRADMVKLLLAHAADPNLAAAQSAQTPLYIAAEYGFTEVVKSLLAAQANPNLNTSLGISPLHRAAENGFIDIVSLLILAKADLNGKDQAGKTALDYALAANRKEVVNLLLQNGAQATAPLPPGAGTVAGPATGANPGSSNPAGGGKADSNATLDPVQAKAFLDACTVNDDAKVVALLKENPNLVFATGPTGYNALHFLAHGCNIETVKKILDLGLPVDSRHKYLRTPLHRAAEFGNLAMVQLLLERGADVNAVDNENMNPLHFSAKNADMPAAVKTLEYLLDHKADPKMKDNEGLTPYGQAKKAGNTLSIPALEVRGIKE